MIKQNIVGFIIGVLVSVSAFGMWFSFSVNKKLDNLFTNDVAVANFLDAVTQGQFNQYIKSLNK